MDNLFTIITKTQTIESLTELWTQIKNRYPKAASSFIETYFGKDNTENWDDPKSIDVIDFSNLDKDKLEEYKNDIQNILNNPSQDMNLEQKILFAFIWKNAGMDLKKIPAIICGLFQESDKNDEARDCYGYPNLYSDIEKGKDSTVFYQYGLYLKSKKDGTVNYSDVEPIIDQHTLRAWHYLHKEIKNIKTDKKNEPEQNAQNISDYKIFYQNIVKQVSLSDVKISKKAYYLLNAIMFVLGKGIEKNSDNN